MDTDTHKVVTILKEATIAIRKALTMGKARTIATHKVVTIPRAVIVPTDILKEVIVVATAIPKVATVVTHKVVTGSDTATHKDHTHITDKVPTAPQALMDLEDSLALLSMRYIPLLRTLVASSDPTLLRKFPMMQYSFHLSISAILQHSMQMEM